MSVERLRRALGSVADTKGVLAILADHELAQKREVLYPALVPLVTELVTGTRAPEPQSTRVLFRFFAGELVHAPELAPALFEALTATPPRHAHDLLHELYVLARDRRAITLLRGGAAYPMWSDAVIALAAIELLDEITAALAHAPTRDLAVACGHVGGERARDVLASSEGDAVHPIGLAFLANPDDKAYFAAGNTPNRVVARRIHTALAARGPKQRMDALIELAKGLELADPPAPTERLLACTAALGDKRADVVERAAAILAAHANAVRGKLRPVFFAAFLERAARAVASGVTETARGYLDTVHRRIPSAPPLGTTRPVEAPLARKAAAKKKGKEMLATMQEATFTASDLRDAGIEAQIAADPETPAPYTIYADWLQTRGDARGQWITLHTLKGLAAKAALDTFLREHRESILGPLRPYLVDEPPVELEWFMGFVRRAQFAVHATEDVVRAVLDATCGAFVQELAFPDDALAAPVIDLLRARRPPALARLVFGTHDEPPAALVALLPRLTRDPLARWTAALARLAELRKTKRERSPDDLPALTPKPNLGVVAERDVILRGLKQELGLGHPIGLVGAMHAVFTPASLDAFVLALAHVHETHPWALAAAGALGGPQTARFLGEALLVQQATSRMITICDQLRAIAARSPAAVEELVHAAHAAATPRRVREVAAEALADLLPHGIDAGFAAAAPSSDARARDAQRAWLETLMVEGRTLSRADFDNVIAYRLADARTLLWSDRASDGTIAGLFRLDERGVPVRRDGTPYELRGGITLVHPAELSDAVLATARTAFAEVAQAILQLERPVFGLSEEAARTEELTRFAKRRVGFHPIAAALRDRGWYVAMSEVDDDDDRWRGTDSFARAFPRDGVVIMATLNSTRGSIATVGAWAGDARRTFDQLHVVTLSELLWDLEVAHGWRAEPARAPAPPPPTGAAPVVERAKSGRSKCVVCTQPIAKDALRIGIERMVETPAFRGMATVWLHPACRADVPELAGVELDGID